MALFATAALLGLVFVACVFLGEEVPGDDAPPELLDLDEDEGPDNPKGDESDAPPPAPSKSEDEGKTPADKTSNWAKAMAELEQHIPDEHKQTFRNRVEQGGRWGRGEGSEELDSLKERFARAEKAAQNIAKQFAVDEGTAVEEILDMFAEWTPQELAEQFGIEKPAPEEQPTTPEAKAVAALRKEVETMKQEAAKAKENAEMEAKKAEFFGAFEPGVTKAVEAFGVAEADKAKVTEAYEKVAGNMAERLIMTSSKGSTVKASVEQALKELDEALNTILDARQSKRPRRPKGQVKVNPDAEPPGKGESFDEVMDEFASGFEKDITNYGGSERV
jgi:hypothetical protein